MASLKMHQTTVRFGADLWQALDEECSQLGISIAQFVREAALARLMYVAGRRGDPEFALALERSGAAPAPQGRGDLSELQAVAGALDRTEARSAAFDRSASEISQSSALWAQGQLARRRARELRDSTHRKLSR
jgi:hypothetical protein